MHYNKINHYTDTGEDDENLIDGDQSFVNNPGRQAYKNYENTVDQANSFYNYPQNYYRNSGNSIHPSNISPKTSTWPRMWMRTEKHVVDPKIITNYWKMTPEQQSRYPWYIGCDFLWTNFVVDGITVDDCIDESNTPTLSPKHYMIPRNQYNSKFLAN